MRSVLRFILKHHFIILFLIIETFSLALVINYNDFQRSAFFSSSSRMAGNIYQSVAGIKQYFMLRQINEELASENAFLRSRLPDSYHESEQYFSTVYDSLTQKQYVYRSAKVLNNSINKRFNYITINQGSRNGIKPD